MYLYNIFREGVIIDTKQQIITPCRGVIDALTGLWQNSIFVSVISDTMPKIYVEQLIDLFGWEQFIKGKQLFSGSKDKHLKL